MSQQQVSGMVTTDLETTTSPSNPPKLYLIDTIDNNGHPLTKLIEIKDEDE